MLRIGHNSKLNNYYPHWHPRYLYLSMAPAQVRKRHTYGMSRFASNELNFDKHHEVLLIMSKALVKWCSIVDDSLRA